MNRLKALLKVIVFIALGLFLGSRLLNGTLSFYIHPRFNILTVLTAVTLIIVGLIYGRQHLPTIFTGEEPDHEHHHQDHAHDPDHNLTWLGLIILAIPVVLGLVVRPQPLGANALQTRDINIGSLTSAYAPDRSDLSKINTSSERNILDWLYLFQQSENLSEFNGEAVNAIGFVYQDERFGEDEFMVSRFTVACCVADANPVGLIVSWPETADLQPDQWVEVSGTLQTGTFDGFEIVFLMAETVTPTDTPAQPYLFQ